MNICDQSESTSEKSSDSEYKSTIQLSSNDIQDSNKNFIEVYPKYEPKINDISYSNRFNRSDTPLIKDIQKLTLTDQKIWFMLDLSPFFNLKQIWLNRNQILSIEPMQWMHMPQLIKISLSYNNLTSIKSLRRLYLPKLDQIQVDHNFILEADCISEMKINKFMDIWIFCREPSIQNNKIIQRINSKFRPFKLRQ